MADTLIRWLHLSDFHTGKDNYGQRQIFDYILDNIRARKEAGVMPNFVFITGDLANKGQLSEYELFTEQFLVPLNSLLPKASIYTVPGNHDVDRTKARSVRRYDVLSFVPEFLDPTDTGRLERQNLFERFTSYSGSDLAPGGDWLFGSAGSYTAILAVNGLKVGVLGINTAWLSESDQDDRKLSPGKSIVEDGLKSITQCDVRLVLGHHPLDWLIPEERDAIRALFAKHNVLYLHGHLHKTHSQPEWGAGQSFLAIQAGACFQARENEQWLNRILWCTLDLTEQQLRLEPFSWSRSNQEWRLDGSDLPEKYRQLGSDYWTIPLPAKVAEANLQPNQTGEFTPGWIYLDQEHLAQYRGRGSTDRILRYFDGSVPGWEEATSPDIPRRSVVEDIKGLLQAARERREPSVTVILGAGGEGKSTVLRQVLSDLAVDSAWRIIWHEDVETALPISRLHQLSGGENTWLLASDDAELIAREVFDTIKSFHGSGRKNVHFLLCCRDTDWLSIEANLWPWTQYGSFVPKHLRGLVLDDAELIVNAWSKYGSVGLAQLANDAFNPQAAAVRLVEEAHAEAVRTEGAFFGAMLRVRLGDGLKDHLRELLFRLRERKVPGGTLFDAFVYIAALHAIDRPILSKMVLAGLLGCKPGDIKQRIIGPLGDEAGVVGAGLYYSTRHRAIAETSLEILAEDFHIDLDEKYIELVRTAQQLYNAGESVPNSREWAYLSSDIFKTNPALGILLAQETLRQSPHNPYFIVQLAQLYRKAGKSEEGLQLLHAVQGSNFTRGFYYEWSTTEGVAGNVNLSVWLAGVALADNSNLDDISYKTAILCLCSISRTLFRTFDKDNQFIFIEGGAAAAQLVKALDLNGKMISPEAAHDIQRGLTKSKEYDVEEFSSLVAIEVLSAAIAIAWELREGELPQWISKGNRLTFYNLLKLLPKR